MVSLWCGFYSECISQLCVDSVHQCNLTSCVNTDVPVLPVPSSTFIPVPPLSTTDLVGPHVANPLYWEQHAAEPCGTGKRNGEWLRGWVGQVWMPSFLITHPSSSSSNGPMQHCVNTPNLPEGSLEYALKELPLHREGQPTGLGRGLAALLCAHLTVDFMLLC